MTAANGTGDPGGANSDERLPLRWAVILTIAVGAGLLAGFLGGPLAGLGVGIAVCGLLTQILGH
ncbi:hypothetical protein DMH01_38145 [Amycolatopsis sp. WAC 04182]|uniref:hypothetical protein n=1 Tax=Amycolatopsis sp. WAC 04182 TaxID=2203198 RepID=UPI000F7B16A6|nr:hypothetical protein [Amycolatopsis sp. WAC 04182]RSN53535.1 hypothetical protein DMH01_38145 [Amycolatopsis sp. WAC 04182]